MGANVYEMSGKRAKTCKKLASGTSTFSFYIKGEIDMENERIDTQEKIEQFLKENEMMFYKLARNFSGQFKTLRITDDMEEIVQIGMAKAVEVLPKWDPLKETKATSYVWGCVQRNYIYILRGTKSIAHQTLLRCVPYVRDMHDGSKTWSMLDAMEDVAATEELEKVEATVGDAPDVPDELWDDWKKLTAYEKMLLELSIGINGRKKYSQKEIATLICGTSQRVSKMVSKAKEKLYKGVYA